MGTRGYIGVKCGEGVAYIYCDRDSYLEGVGEILKEHYSDEEKVAVLLHNGNICCLGTSPEEDLEGWDINGLIKKREEVVPEKTLYYKSRGDENTETMLIPNVEMYINDALANNVEYVYLFEDGVWRVYSKEQKRFAKYEI